MKNLLFLAMAITFAIQSAWADNAKRVYINDDGSVTFEEPFFLFRGKQNPVLGSLNVCRFLGYSTKVEAFFGTSDVPGVVLNADGRLKGPGRGVPVTEVTCRDFVGQPANNAFDKKSVTNGSEVFVNSDGSVSVEVPFFIYKGKKRAISTLSDLNGVCAFLKLAPEMISFEGEASTDDKVRLDAAGKMSHQPDKGERRITSVTCRPPKYSLTATILWAKEQLPQATLDSSDENIEIPQEASAGIDGEFLVEAPKGMKSNADLKGCIREQTQYPYIIRYHRADGSMKIHCLDKEEPFKEMYLTAQARKVVSKLAEARVAEIYESEKMHGEVLHDHPEYIFLTMLYFSASSQ